MACHKTKKHTPDDPWADYRKAYGFLSTHRDSAFYYFNRAATGSTDKAQVAPAFYNMAFIQSQAGDYYGAQESLTSSLKSLDESRPKDRNYLADDYNQLGMTFYSLNDNAQALYYYKQALKYADNQQLPYILNNQGNSYKDLKAFGNALACYKTVIKLAGGKGTSYARVLTNLAMTKWLQDPNYNAAPELLRSLAIRVSEQDIEGENSSYAHLADFYMDRRPDSALWYAKKMLGIAGQLHNADDQLYALRKLILLASPEQAKNYFQRYQAVSDSAESKRSAAKNQFAVIRYNVEKAKAENIQLQKKNTERRYQLFAVLALSGLAIVWMIWWYRKRKQRVQLQAETEIRESKLRLSQKVHDQVANGIYSIMSEVEHSQELDKTTLIDKLDNVYEVSRNIAHDEPGADDDFSKRINALLNAFKRPAIRLAVSGNEPELWQGVSKDAKQQLELVLQELMVNISKHSQATLAHVGFVIEQGDLKIECRDNGVGMTNPDQPGKGLQNTVSRIKRLNGRVTFDTQAATGFCIFIHLPLALP